MVLAPRVVRHEGSADAYRPMSPSPPPPPYSLCNSFPPKAVPRNLLSAGLCKFLVGDFLGLVSLLRDLIDAVQDGARASGEQEALMAELRNLESAILQVEAHYMNTESPAQRMALDQAAHACQKSVNDFLSSVQERQREVRADGTGHTGSNGDPDMRWNLVTIEDIVNFRCRVSAHVQSIQTLLITVQVSSSETARGHESIRSGHSTQTGLMKSTKHSVVLINESFDTLRQALVDQGSISQQTLASVDAVREIMILNSIKLQSALQQLQDSLPAQVMLQQPVIFTDALDRIAPIHLDWISTWDAFLAVLELRFAHLGYNKIKRREFALQETGSRKDLLFTRSIGMCLTPGQQVDMSMVFQDQASEELSNTCPHCQTRCQGSTDSETTCPHCGCQFRRIQQQDDSSEAIREAMSIQTIIAPATAGTPKKRRRTLQSIPDDEVRPSDFKRLRLMCSPPSSMKRRSRTLEVYSILNPKRQVETQPDPGLEIHQILQQQAQDPYAMYGGYNNYVALWYKAQQQQQQKQPSEQKVATPWRCHNCNRTKISKPWRGPDGSGTLCDACGLHYMQLTRKMALIKNEASTRSNRELNNPDASKLARKQREFNLRRPLSSIAAIDEDFVSHGRWDPVESVRNDKVDGGFPSWEPNWRNSPWSTLTLKTDPATDSAADYDSGWDWMQPPHISEAVDQYRTMPWAQPIQSAPVGDAHEGHELRREWSDGLSAASSQHILPQLDSRIVHGPSYEPYETPFYQGVSGSSYQSRPAKTLHKPTDNPAANYQNSDSHSKQPTSHDSSRSSSPLEFLPGPQEFILSRIETPALNTTVGWSTPGEKITANHFSFTNASSEAYNMAFSSWTWAGWVNPTSVTFPFKMMTT